MSTPQELSYQTTGGLRVTRVKRPVEYPTAIEELAAQLDRRQGVLLSSSYEFPNRYKRWDLGFVDPPLVVTSRERAVELRALNARGTALLAMIARRFSQIEILDSVEVSAQRVAATVRPPPRRFAEEERSSQPSVFSVVRWMVALFASDLDSELGLYGAFGYDLAFQFEAVPLRMSRPAEQRDLVLFVPDRLLVRDHERNEAYYLEYDFRSEGHTTEGLARDGAESPYELARSVAQPSDHKPGEYASVVKTALQSFARGDLFEVVPGQTFFAPCSDKPSAIFNRLRQRNPAPYGFFMNLGGSEFLLGASPEMFIRVNGKQVESCPISGTIARGANALDDATQILALLNSEKDSAELTMCTDVDRNDKSRVCVPGSVTVVARRQIEMYSRLIHTVDHVKGILQDRFDGIDAFLSHMWAVTVTGAPKLWAMRFLEQYERSPRQWYGGAIGRMTFDGNINTGLTLRTVHIRHGIGAIRVGATLLYDSDPESEERETQLKASALLDAITRHDDVPADASRLAKRSSAGALRILLVDHQDSFVHTLANYLRQTGAEVVTWRYGFDFEELRQLQPQLVVLSPGPGSPKDFSMQATIDMVRKLDLPLYGVCLGLQGMVEYCGGQLAVLPTPAHGRSTRVHVTAGRLFEGLPETFTVGRYHSLHAQLQSFPAELEITAVTEDGIVMAVEHKQLPWGAVQFHPESILTVKDEIGLRMLERAIQGLCRQRH